MSTLFPVGILLVDDAAGLTGAGAAGLTGAAVAGRTRGGGGLGMTTGTDSVLSGMLEGWSGAGGGRRLLKGDEIDPKAEPGATGKF